MKDRFKWVVKKTRKGTFYFVQDIETDEILHCEDIINLLNKLYHDLNYLHLRFLNKEFNTKITDMKVTERYRYDENFPYHIKDTKNEYGQYSRLIDIKNACAIMNDYENMLRYREEEINKLNNKIQELKNVEKKGIDEKC